MSEAATVTKVKKFGRQGIHVTFARICRGSALKQPISAVLNRMRFNRLRVSTC